MFDKGFFGGLFDVDRDGSLNPVKRAMDFAMFCEMMEDENQSDEEEELMSDLETAGLDYDELSYMDEDERREVLDSAGLDADDYDFY